MNYYVLVMLMHFRCQSVIGQIAPIFGLQNTNPQEPPIFGSQSGNDLTPFLSNNDRQIINIDNQCYCMLTSTCTGSPLIQGKDNFNTRIVNYAPDGSDSCPTNYILCCSGVPQPTNPVCGRRKVLITSRVRNVAPYGAYPWQAAMFERLTDQYIGAGVVISSTFILTAAHKVFRLNNNFRIRLGLWTLSVNTYPYFEANPVFTMQHGYFNRFTLQNDIAIIQLDRPVPFTNYVNINTACLPTSTPAAGTRCWTAGWGVTSFNSDNYQNPLREVEVPIMELSTCEYRLRGTRLGVHYTLDRSSFICAGGEPGRDACTGDGGGALVCQIAEGQFQVVGLTSWGVGCGKLNIPGIYTNVYTYRTWISNHVPDTANSG